MTDAITFLNSWKSKLNDQFKHAKRTTATLKYQNESGNAHVYAISKKPDVILSLTAEDLDNSVFFKELSNLLQSSDSIRSASIQVEFHSVYSFDKTPYRYTWNIANGDFIGDSLGNESNLIGWEIN